MLQGARQQINVRDKMAKNKIRFWNPLNGSDFLMETMDAVCGKDNIRINLRLRARISGQHCNDCFNVTAPVSYSRSVTSPPIEPTTGSK
jgi:hypothetical protein